MAAAGSAMLALLYRTLKGRPIDDLAQ